MTGSTGSDSAGALSPAEIHDVLRNDRRRLVLERLRERDTAETVSDLAEHIGAIEADESPPPRNVRQSVYVSLHQTHLPKLDDLGIIAYDSDGKTVELAANASGLDAYLDVDSGTDSVPATYYLGIGILGAAALLATLAGVPGLRAIGPAAVGLVSLGLVIAVASYQLRSGDE
jgi:predicted transcriptional regulator